MTWNVITPRKSSAIEDGCAIHIAVRPFNEKNRAQVAVMIYESFMKSIRWQCGDRVQVAIDGTKIGLKRVPSGGYALTPTGSGGDARAKLIGKSATGRIQFTKPDVFPMNVGDSFQFKTPLMDDEWIVIDVSKASA